MSNSSVSNNRGGVDRVNQGSGVDSVNNWGSVDSVNNGAGDHRGVIGGSSVSHRVSHHSLGVLGGAIIGHISNIASIAIGVIVDMLDPAIGKSHGVRSLSIAGTIRALRLLEVGLGVVIGHGVGEGVGGGLGEVISNISSLDWGVVSGSGVDNRGGVGGGGVDGVVHGSVDSVSDNRGGVDSVVDRGVDSVVDRGVDKRGVNGVSHVLGGDRVERDHSGVTLGNGAVSEHRGLDLSQALGVISLSHAGVGGTESLALSQGSHLDIVTD